MVQPATLAAAFACLFFAALLTRRTARERRTIRTLGNLAPRPVAALQAGLTMTKGRLQGDPLLRSPLQGRPCLYYFFRVLEPLPEGKERTLATGKLWTLVRVEDDTGTAAVEAVPALVASPRRHTREFTGLTTIPEDLAPFFEAAGIDAKHLPRLPRFTAHEYTLEPGDDVYVTGEVRVENGQKVFYRTRDSPLVVSAEPDVGLLPGLRTEMFVHGALTTILYAGATALAFIALS